MNPVPFLVLVSLAIVAFRFYQPWIARTEGALVRRSRVPLTVRARLQRANVYAVAVMMVLGGIGGWLPGAVQLLIAGAVVVILIIPLHYTLTVDGIALGRTRLRSWSDFAGVERAGGRAVLTPVGDERPMEVWLPAGSGGDAIEAQLISLVAGTNTVAPMPAVPKDHSLTVAPARRGNRRRSGHDMAKRAV